MKRRTVAAVLVLGMLLGGCSSWMDGHYVSVEPHTDQGYQNDQGITAVLNYQQLRSALTDIIQSGAENGVISIEKYGGRDVNGDMADAIHYIRERHPIGAYAVEEISYEIGTTGGVAAVAVSVAYNQKRAEIQRIKQVRGMDTAEELITAALTQCETGIVLQVSDYRSNADYAQMVQDYAEMNPDKVMEIPQVTANVYPDSGSVRVVELLFTYQTSRDSLRTMQSYVQQVFTSAWLYVGGEGEQSVKFEQLYTLLMGRYDYKVETSITPTYSLLRYGVGDSKAFATVYAAMCQKAELECQVVSGTRAGEPWFWNIICEDGVYYHVDLLRSHSAGDFRRASDGEMEGYVWDYSAYPACGPEAEETTDGTQ